MQNYPKLLTSRGLGAQCSKHAGVLLIIAVMIISEFEPHSMSPVIITHVHSWVTIEMHAWGMKLIFASRKLAMCSKIEHNTIESHVVKISSPAQNLIGLLYLGILHKVHCDQ